MAVVKSITVVNGLVTGGTGGLVGTSDMEAGLLSSPTGIVKAVSTGIPGGATYASKAIETAFAQKWTVPAGTLRSGDVIVLELAGTFGTTILAPNITGKVKFGGTTLLNTGALTLLANITNNPWTARVLLTVNVTGASGQLECSAVLMFSTSATAALTALVNGGAVTVDSSVDADLTVTVQYSASDPANTITLRQFIVGLLRPDLDSGGGAGTGTDA